MSQTITKAIFPVAGLGTRFLPATKVMPKEMLPVFDKPLIQLAVEEAFHSGIKLCILITRRGKSLMVDHFDFAPELERLLQGEGDLDKLEAVQNSTTIASQIVSVRQQRALGLGHAVGCAAPFLNNEPFAVLLPDDYIESTKPCLQQMIEAWHEVGGNLVATQEVPKDHVNRYGILDVGEQRGSLTKASNLIEKPNPATAPSRLAIIGRYLLDPAVMQAIQTTKPDGRGEVQLTDAIKATLGTVTFHGYQFEGQRFDCGQPIGFLEANITRALASKKYGTTSFESLQRIMAQVNNQA